MTSSGCAPSVDPVIAAPTYPPAPAYMAPVAVPDVISGDDVRLSLARHRAALVTANGRLTQSRAWYEQLARGQK